MARGSLSVSTLFLAAMVVTPDFRRFALGFLGWFFGLKLFQIVAEAIKTLVVEAAIVFEPIIDLLQGARLDAAGPPLRLAGARNQSGAFQHLQVLGYGPGSWRTAWPAP